MLAAALPMIRRELAVQEVDSRELTARRFSAWELAARVTGRRLAARVTSRRLAARVAGRGIVWVLVARQEPKSGPQRQHARQLEVGPLGQNLDLVDGQGDADFTAPGVQAPEPAVADPRHQTGDLEDDGQAELEGMHP